VPRQDAKRLLGRETEEVGKKGEIVGKSSQWDLKVLKTEINPTLQLICTHNYSG